MCVCVACDRDRAGQCSKDRSTDLLKLLKSSIELPFPCPLFRKVQRFWGIRRNRVAQEVPGDTCEILHSGLHHNTELLGGDGFQNANHCGSEGDARILDTM